MERLSLDHQEPLQVLAIQMCTHMGLTVPGLSTFSLATLSAWHSLHLTWHLIMVAERIILKYMTTSLCKNWEGKYVHFPTDLYYCGVNTVGLDIQFAFLSFVYRLFSLHHRNSNCNFSARIAKAACFPWPWNEKHI